MAATETADHTVALPPSLSFSLGKVEIDRERDLERGSEKECVGECQNSTASKKKKKENPKHQNMSEWIITIPRHRGMEWEEGGSRGRDGG